MYVHPAFKVHPATSLAFAGSRGFGLVIASDGGRPVASPLPFRLIEQDGKVPKLEFHVARANPLGAIAEKGGTWLVAVQGHDAYVSPDWYASAEQVPTWLYETVHLSGPVRVIPRRSHAGPHRAAEQYVREMARAEAGMEARQGRGQAARDAAEGDRRGRDDGREHRGQLQAQPAQVRRGSRRGRECAGEAARSVGQGNRQADGRAAAGLELRRRQCESLPTSLAEPALAGA